MEYVLIEFYEWSDFGRVPLSSSVLYASRTHEPFCGISSDAQFGPPLEFLTGSKSCNEEGISGLPTKVHYTSLHTPLFEVSISNVIGAKDCVVDDVEVYQNSLGIITIVRNGYHASPGQ